MASEDTALLPGDERRGSYVPAGAGDKRSPCPMINALANHGYLARNGQNVTAEELKAAVALTGISTSLGAIFTNAIYNEHHTPATKDDAGLFTRLWSTVRDPWTLLSRFGMRRPQQTDSNGTPVLDLDQLALPGAVEHDISLTRRDHAQSQGNCARQQDLVDDLLACSADGQHVTREDLAALRRRRIARQRVDNPGLTYGPLQHEMSCGEIALILGIFGDGKSAPLAFVGPFLREERLPVKEGWQRRWWWTLGLLEVKLIGTQVKKLIGLQVK